MCAARDRLGVAAFVSRCCFGDGICFCTGRVFVSCGFYRILFKMQGPKLKILRDMWKSVCVDDE